jgi:hypothetical protein
METRCRLIFFLFFTILCFPISLWGQADKESNAYYLDDNHLSSAKNVIKIDGMALVHGELPFIFERVLARVFSAEAGLGILLPYYIHDFLPLIVHSAPGFSNNQFGHSLWLKAKLYRDRAPDLDYLDFTFRQRNFSNAELTDISLGWGRQVIVGKRLTFDFGIGVGIRLQRSWGGETAFNSDNSFAPIVPLQIKMGYLF